MFFVPMYASCVMSKENIFAEASRRLSPCFFLCGENSRFLGFSTDLGKMMFFFVFSGWGGRKRFAKRG